MPKTKNTLQEKEAQLIKKLEKIEFDMANIGLKEYIDYLYSPRRILVNNLFAGIAKGLGFVLGATVVVTLVTLLLSLLTGVPIIGEWFDWIKSSLGNGA